MVTRSSVSSMFSNAPLSGRSALVCGASAGIGRAIALSLASMGAVVHVLARRADRLNNVLDTIRAQGGHAGACLVLDLDDRALLAQSIQSLLQQHGPIHILINNTGGPKAGPILDATDDEFVTTFARHVLCAQLLTRTLLPGMGQSQYGRIINIISTSVREPIANLGVSNTIRGAMAAWAKSVSRELPPGVTINNVLPGYTATERLDELRSAVAARNNRSESDINQEWLKAVPEGRLADPSEIAATVAFLASPAAAFIRGVSLPVDGGRMNSI